ncbi:MAG: nucleoside hydrolase [Alphaproteobacteria bacterium]
MAPRPLIIDCDPGKDDTVALMLAFASPAELDVLAVTAVAGNAALPTTQANARRICELCDRADVPVYAGCPRPMLRPLETAEHVHGPDALGGVDLAPPSKPLEAVHAVPFLVERLLASNGQVTVAALGPLTNLALAIVMEPEVVEGIREVVLMGGAIGRGNVTPAAEFNIYTDPHAAAVVLGSGAPVTMIGLEVTRATELTRERLDALRRIDRPAAQTVVRMFAAASGEATLVHDSCVVAYLLRPGLFETAARDVRVETAEGPEVGRTTVREPPPGGGPTVRVATGVDAEGFFRLLTERLARL